MRELLTKRATSFLTISLIVVLVMCIVIFSFLAVFMNRNGADTIAEIGSFYMAGMSEQISLHFSTAIGLRFNQLDVLVETADTSDVTNRNELLDSLSYGARARSFEYLALCSPDGEYEKIYGNDIDVSDAEIFLDSLKNGVKKITLAIDSHGNRLIIMGMPCIFPMEDGSKSVALLAGMPVDYISETLSMNTIDASVYSNIISSDGTFVIRGGDAAFKDNFYDRLASGFEGMAEEDVQNHTQQLRDAIAKGEDYSTVLDMGKERQYLYCTRLDYSEWYLVIIMPYGPMDMEISDLSSHWLKSVYLGCSLIIITLLVIFAMYFVITRQQISELERLQNAAEKAQREAEHASRAKSDFLSNMSHDIRTPMNAIVGMTAIATANIDDRQRVQNCLKKITLSSKHLLGLINDVLDMSKIESGKLTLTSEQVSLREVMDSLVSIVHPQVKSKHLHFDVFINNISTENIYCDSVRLNQVLLNILGNAVKFTPDGGSIQVSMHEEPSEKGDSFVRIHFNIKDSGIGMSPEYKEQIFEAFSRDDNATVNKTEGTGLGMAITKYIVDAMGGIIEVESEQGKGTEFHVAIDFEKAEIKEEDMILPEWNMLLVDDDQQLCESAVESLKDIGLNAEWTFDGESALKMVENRHNMHNDYQIILLDWKLPSMDGISTAREIRLRYGDEIPIILISAYDWGEIENEAKEAGINGFISKPLFKSTLFYGLKKFIGEVDEIQQEEKPPESALEGRRILLAEDNDLNWEIAEELLSNLGMELDWAQNGQICAEKFGQSPVGYYDAILMDVRMPVMTGYQATEAIRAMDRADAKEIPIIAMTADAFNEDILHCLECGMNSHIAKPINISEVSRQLQNFIAQRYADK